MTSLQSSDSILDKIYRGLLYVTLSFCFLPSLGFGMVGFFDFFLLILFVFSILKLSIDKIQLNLLHFLSILLLLTINCIGLFFSDFSEVSYKFYSRAFLSTIVIWFFILPGNYFHLSKRILYLIFIITFIINISQIDFINFIRRDAEFAFFNDINIFLFSYIFLIFLINDSRAIFLYVLMSFISIIFGARLSLVIIFLMIPSYLKILLMIIISFMIVIFFNDIPFSTFGDYFSRGFGDDGYSRVSIWKAYFYNLDWLPSFNALSDYLSTTGLYTMRPPHNSFLYLFMMYGVLLGSIYLTIFCRYMIQENAIYITSILFIMLFFDLFISKELLFILSVVSNNLKKMN